MNHDIGTGPLAAMPPAGLLGRGAGSPPGAGRHSAARRDGADRGSRTARREPGTPVNTAAGAATSRARPRRRSLIYRAASGVLARVLVAAAGSGAVLAAAGGLVTFAACQAGQPDPGRRRPPPPAARRYPVSLLGQAMVLAEQLAALGHEVAWRFGGGKTASTCTGTCQRCTGQVLVSRASLMGDVTVAYPGRALLAPGPAQVLRRCGSSW